MLRHVNPRARATIKMMALAVVGAAVGGGAVAVVQRSEAPSKRTTSRSSSTSPSSSGDTAAGRTATTAAVTRPATPPPGSVRVPILMYHRVSNPATSRSHLERSLTVAPRVFAQQLNWLRAHHYVTITQPQLADAIYGTAELPKNPVMITFDDGYVDISNTVLPLMHKRGMVATAYVITDRVLGADRAFMKVPALRRIEAGGIEVGSHSVSHADLTTLSDAAAMRELEGSRRVLERILGHPVPWLCYPAGRYDARIEALASRAGYVLATTTEPGATHDRSRPLALSRVRISDTTGVSGFSAILG